ncbi:hypothetical protein AWM75_00585 [Aerococcus urinaehominis]|uniref:Uncharacterized protein n=1 Tax=Aerococcus urinaehominis TaxID=128944 RepID=A0A0X8FJQ3_9LACT|nr:DegV family protein [Aerococcus urinaehominis]AMB98579.1 hypothetical protein AWM75_00585 [Aerococcus urinaehominis]SDL77222.1 EDD domain protein, DegV family [Aerococcus urinaehominis]
MKRALIVDSTANIGETLFNHPDIYQANLTVHFNGEEASYVDTWDEARTKAFYEKMAAADHIPTTSQPAPEDFIKAFEAVVAAGYETVYVLTVASQISGTFQTASMISKDYEDLIDIHLVDSGTSSYGMKNMVEHLVAWFETDMTNQEIDDQLAKLVRETYVLGAIHNLTNFQKGGRISHLGGSIAGLFKVAGLFSVHQGKIDIEKVTRGKQRVRQALDQAIDKYISNHPGAFRLAVVHSNIGEVAKEKARDLRQRFPPAKDVVIDNLTIVVGTQLGEDILAYIYLPYLLT